MRVSLPWIQPATFGVLAALAASLTSTELAGQTAASSGTLNVSVFIDANANGTKDTGETGPAGWTIKVTSANSALNVVTGSGGTASRTVAPGSYTVKLASLPGGWSGTSTSTKAVSVAAVGTQTVDFGVVAPTNSGPPTSGPANIQLQVFNDLNGNTQMDGGEGLIAGWTFTVSGPGLSQPRTLVIPASSVGGVAMGIPSGTYTVTLAAKAGWAATGAMTRSVVIPPGGMPIYSFGMKATP